MDTIAYFFIGYETFDKVRAKTHKPLRYCYDSMPRDLKTPTRPFQIKNRYRYTLHPEIHIPALVRDREPFSSLLVNTTYRYNVLQVITVTRTRYTYIV